MGRGRRASNSRLHPVPSRTENVARLSRRQLEMLHVPYPEGVERPRTRGDCANGVRPCPFVSCVHNLYLDVSESTGNVLFNFPDREPGDMPANESCALDLADTGGLTLERTGDVLNVTRERIRQLEVKAVARLKARAPRAAIQALAELAEHDDQTESHWDDAASESGGAGGGIDDDDTSGSTLWGRGMALDPDEQYCDRVERAYELALTRREKGWARPALLPVPEPPPLTEEQEARVAAALGTEIEGWEPPAEEETAPPPPAPMSGVRVCAPENETTTRESPMKPIPPKAAEILRFLQSWFEKHPGPFDAAKAALAFGSKTPTFRAYLSALRSAGYLVGENTETRLKTGAVAAIVESSDDEAAPAPKAAARRPRAEKTNGAPPSKLTDESALAAALRARRARLAGEIAAIDTLLEAYAS